MGYKFKLFSVVLLLMTSCSNDVESGRTLSAEDKAFIRKLGILDKDEKIILFDSQGGLFKPNETSGNFFTEKRIASYWIDERRGERTEINSAFYSDIDTIWRYSKYRAVTLASYLEVHRKNGTKFKVYVDADSAGTWKFFNRALEEWSHANSNDLTTK
jgi:hypothetical protein